MKYIATLKSAHNGSKIPAIKDLREIFRLGLTEAKNFVEQNDCKHVEVLVSAEQVAKIVEIKLRPATVVEQWAGGTPILSIVKLVPAPAFPFYDFSNNVI